MICFRNDEFDWLQKLSPRVQHIVHRLELTPMKYMYHVKMMSSHVRPAKIPWAKITFAMAK